MATTKQGQVRGRVNANGVSSFYGIPYGGPTIGTGRFRPPTAPARWADVRDATAFGPAAPQIAMGGDPVQTKLSGFYADDEVQSEDCLVLNVWTPALDDGQRPVMVWWHGGGFTFGSGSYKASDGAALAARGDVVVVSVNHRLNVFGHLYLGPEFGEEYANSGNVGMLDLAASLRWVQDNIASFGGDPGNVTVFGASGGGAKVVHAMAMPEFHGLFQRGIVISGHDLWRRACAEDAARSSNAVLAQLGIEPGDIEKLTSTPTEAWIGALEAAWPNLSERPSLVEVGAWFHFDLLAPVVDHHSLYDFPLDAIAAGSAIGVSLMVGVEQFDHFFPAWTVGEGFGWLDGDGLKATLQRWLGAHTDRIADGYARSRLGESPSVRIGTILTDGDWRVPATRLAEAKVAAGGEPPYMYFWAGPRDIATTVFDSPEVPTVPPTMKAMNGQVIPAFVAFARDGDPNHANMPAWAPYDLHRRETMVMDKQWRLESDPHGDERELWDGIR